MAATLKTSTNFGGSPTDGNRVPLATLGSYMQTADATASPVVSPVTVTTGTTLTVPAQAIKVTIFSSAALRISEVSNAATYFVLPANIAITIDITRQGFLYLVQDSGSCTVQFYFSMV